MLCTAHCTARSCSVYVSSNFARASKLVLITWIPKIWRHLYKVTEQSLARGQKCVVSCLVPFLPLSTLQIGESGIFFIAFSKCASIALPEWNVRFCDAYTRQFLYLKLVLCLGLCIPGYRTTGWMIRGSNPSRGKGRGSETNITVWALLCLLSSLYWRGSFRYWQSGRCVQHRSCAEVQIEGTGTAAT
jgi:hypothetical protein